ncbi:hypothetical protein OSC52_14540 [Clostridium pasteurianum]|uniref:hypothetical protein n=1 Tax=Clostridium pasteurianum TaxID=1501 RepID=UPI002260E07A|nr:hypothetical protein [Clostridium pasteurianum]UZW13059.1 hypothetical protein OSC52_14540 [Clostridium pasteurianum]
MLIEIAGFVGGKLIDKIFDKAMDATIDKVTKEKIIQEYNKVKKCMCEKLISENINERYFEYLQQLIDKSTIIDIIFNFSYFFTNLSETERKRYIEEYICDFFEGQDINSFDLLIIKAKIIKQYEYCFTRINKPNEESRKIINQILLRIANSSDEQQKMLTLLKCDIKDLETTIHSMKQMLLTGDVDIEYLHELTKNSIDNLKIRFSREFNVDVELSDWLSKFCNTSENKKQMYLAAKEVKKAISQVRIIDNISIIKQWEILIKKLNENTISDYQLLEKETEQFIELADAHIKEKYKNLDKDYYQSNEYYEWRHLCISNGKLDEYRRALGSDTLVVTGEAGIGKSHSIANFIFNEYYNKNKICIFILGQHLNEQLDPVKMIENTLHIPYTLQRFLNELNEIAEENNIEVPFVVEGINEGFHSEVWKNYYEGLIGIFESYNRIKLILSIRKTYIKKCLPEGYGKREKTLIIEHKGFDDNTIDAVTAFFDYYGIDKPTFPILYSDFYNPLFLHTLCKTVRGSEKVKINEYNSFTEIFTNYISVVEKSVADHCGYMVGLKLVKKTVDSVIKYSLDNNIRYGIKIDTFYEIVCDVVDKYRILPTDFVQAMIDNGLFYSDLYGYNVEEEYIQFAYERYHNILAADYLISDIISKEELIDSINIGRLKPYFDKSSNGIIEELFVMIPEKFNVELLELLEDDVANTVLEPFLNSLIWRKSSTISIEKTVNLINKFIVVRKCYFDKFLDIQMIVAPIEENPLNAKFLHNYLKKFNMAIRDSFWVEKLYRDTNYGKVLNNLLRLCKSQKQLYTKETKHLIAILIIWSFAGTNNIYRENAIRALVGLLENDFDMIDTLIDDFSVVDDGYVKEAMYCSIYGAVLRTCNLSGAEKLAKAVYKDIFDKEEVFPHIIVRAHAKEIIDYILFKGFNVKIDVRKIQPPYNSKWYDSVLTLEDIKKYEYDYRDPKVTREQYAVNKIISSMATNTGGKSSMYGDFGRYIFEGWVEPWEYHFIAQDLSNIVVKIIMDQYGYNFNIHGKFDSQLRDYDRHKHDNERIGKKYQRIASFEMLARLADNFEPGDVETVYSEEYSNWNNNRFRKFLEFEEDMSDEEEEFEIDEDDVKEIFKPYKYEGPWQFGYRGIDPTVMSKPVEDEKNLWENIYIIPDIEDERWACENTSEPDLRDILFVNYCGDEFIVLEMYNTWKGKCCNYEQKPKEYFVKAVAMLAPEDKEYDFTKKNKISEYAEGRNNNQSYTIFAREYYWSDAYKYLENQIAKDYEYEEPNEFIDTGFDYQCPSSYSEKVENVISSYAIPSKYIVDELNLFQLEDGKWFDKYGNLVSLDAQVDGYHGALLIKKDKLFELMKKNKLSLLWGIYTEKKGYPQFFATRKVALWKNKKLIVQQYNEEQWTSRY